MIKVDIARCTQLLRPLWIVLASIWGHMLLANFEVLISVNSLSLVPVNSHEQTILRLPCFPINSCIRPLQVPLLRLLFLYLLLLIQLMNLFLRKPDLLISLLLGRLLDLLLFNFFLELPLLLLHAGPRDLVLDALVDVGAQVGCFEFFEVQLIPLLYDLLAAVEVNLFLDHFVLALLDYFAHQLMRLTILLLLSPILHLLIAPEIALEALDLLLARLVGLLVVAEVGDVRRAEH